MRANEGFIALFAATIVKAVVGVAPNVQLRFVPRPVKNAVALREGQVDLDVGVLGDSAPEVRTRTIFRNRFVGVVRADHLLLACPLTPAAYAASGHVIASRRDVYQGPIDRALAALGLRRRIVAIVPGFPDALRIARESDLIAQVPKSLVCASLASSATLAEGLAFLEVPVSAPEIVISAMWHPRLDAEPAHRWLREAIVEVCRRSSAVRMPFVGQIRPDKE